MNVLKGTRKAKNPTSGLVSPQLPLTRGKAKTAKSQGSGIVGGYPLDFGCSGGKKVGAKAAARQKPTKMY
jgi:hypothetical protein